MPSLKSAIIDRIENYLLELGKGFLFEARQKRFTFNEAHFFVDLVFYNRLLRCYVLIAHKIGKLNHTDLGQMQMYVNYFDCFVKLTEKHPSSRKIRGATADRLLNFYLFGGREIAFIGLTQVLISEIYLALDLVCDTSKIIQVSALPNLLGYPGTIKTFKP